MTDAYSDLLEDDEDSQPDDKPDSKANAAFAQQRKELKEAQKKLAELEAFKADREKADRETAITGVFKEVGLNPKHAKLFAIAHPEGDATPELVAQFANEYGLVTTEGDEVAPPAPAERQHGFTPTVIEGGTAPAGKTYTQKEFEDVMRENPARGRQLAEAGKVRWNNPQVTDR